MLPNNRLSFSVISHNKTSNNNKNIYIFAGDFAAAHQRKRENPVIHNNK